MAGTKWDFETGTTATAVSALFAGKESKRPKNPFDGDDSRPLTDEEREMIARCDELAKEARAKAVRGELRPPGEE